MIRTFRHTGLEKFFKTGSKAGIQPVHAARLYLQLAALDVAKLPGDLAVPAWKLHRLKGNMDGHWAIKVDGNWRMTFRFEGEDAILVDYQDYHGA
ncbi:MAG: type II toxin-antitoxin system RelE/ParE family toxin [Terracidiphilus sp.]|nr:type II toxin-antitoxin system RelE/ParE family toxin [Terracidiphilus sp.]